jgi:hypothetical protein
VAQRLVVGGETAPDGVANIRVDQAWGSAQVSAAVHQVRSSNFQNPTRFFGPEEQFRPGIPDTEYGYAVQGGVKINLPFIAAGDVLWLQAAYAEGAVNYLGYGGRSGTGIASPLTLGVTDAFVGPRGDLELTEGFTVTAAFLHYFTPQLRAGLIGSYGELDFNRSGTGIINRADVVGTPLARLAGGRTGFVDFEEFRVEGNLIYSPVKDLDIGVDVLYQNVDPKGRVVRNEVNIQGARQAGFRLISSEDIVVGRLRIQRDF